MLYDTSYLTPNGNPLWVKVRAGTNDGAMASAILAADEYQLQGLAIEGWALDIGSHIGTVALALAVDNPNLKVVAVEPVPDNCEVIRASIAANGLGERVFLEEASAGAPGQATLPCRYNFTAADNADPNYLHDSRFVGNVFRKDANPVGALIDAPVVTITGLCEKYGTAEFRFCKIDCEGCEWDFLSAGAVLIREIIGEWHDNPYSRMDELLGPTHDVTLVEDKGGIGLFRAVRRG